jgi:SAM-dependent methyltransferase
MDLSREVEFFDRFQREHHDYDVLGENAYRRLLTVFRDVVRPRAGERCVDLGCGTGAFTRRLRTFGLELSGFDISPASIERAASLARTETYAVRDIRSTGLHDRSIDIIVFSGVLHHFPTRTERRSVLAEGLRVLRPGGRMFAFDPSAHSPSMRLYRDPRSPLYSSAGKTENEILIDRRDLEDELRAVGFSAVAVRGIAGMTFRYIAGRIASKLLPMYNLYELALERSPLEDRYGTFLATVAWRASGS